MQLLGDTDAGLIGITVGLVRNHLPNGNDRRLHPLGRISAGN